MPSDAGLVERPAFTCFILDMDGTIVDTAADNARAANLALRELGFDPLPVETVTSYIGGGVPRIMRRCLGESADAYLDKAVDAFMRHYEADPVALSVPYAGVDEALGYIVEHGGRIGVATQTPEDLAQEILDGVDLARYVNVVVGPESVKKRKPDPEPILKVLGELGGTSHKAILVGDAPSDLQAARAAGVTTCAALYGYGSIEALRAEEPAYSITHFPELLSQVAVNPGEN